MPLSDLGFHHVFVPAPIDDSKAPTLLLLHGTGGTENDLVDIGRTLSPSAALLSPRGKVLENGMPRFFRRLAEGVFDEEDLIFRTHELADFVEAAGQKYGFNPAKVVAVGYSNGANIAASLLLLQPELLAGAVLLRPMVPLVPENKPVLENVKVLILSGDQDPLIPTSQPSNLYEMLKEAGAEVTFSIQQAGHRLVQEDFSLAREWLEKF